MEFQNVIYGTNIRKKFKGFHLDIEELKIPKGFATALIGENGAGKTTLLNILAGIRLDYKGNIQYFDEKTEDVEKAKERLGYTGPNSFFLPQWTLPQIEKISSLLFDNFDGKKYQELCQELSISAKGIKKDVSSLSDGNRMKLTLAAVFARDTECLLMDEPASPLDPLMRGKLWRTRQGFVEDLKEKYILVKGDAEDASLAKKYLYSFSSSSYGFEGLCLVKDLDKLAGINISKEVPSLFQISVAVMKASSTLR